MGMINSYQTIPKLALEAATLPSLIRQINPKNTGLLNWAKNVILHIPKWL
jgi:hypothetical protein